MNRRRDINRIIILSAVVAAILIIILIGVLVRMLSNRAR